MSSMISPSSGDILTESTMPRGWSDDRTSYTTKNGDTIFVDPKDWPPDLDKIPAGWTYDPSLAPGILRNEVGRATTWGKKFFGRGIGRGKSAEADTRDRIRQLRAALVSSVSPEDIHEIMYALIEKAKEGSITAAREILDRTLGRADESMVTMKLAELEAAIAEGQTSKSEEEVEP